MYVSVVMNLIGELGNMNTYEKAQRVFDDEYSHGEYCHEQSFIWGFQEGVEWKQKEMIEKAKEWFNNNWRRYICQDADGMIRFSGWKTDFEKDMSEERYEDK